MAARISYDELLAKLEDPNTSEQELRAYFTLDEARSDSFHPAVAIDPTVVDTGGREAAVALASFNGYSAWRRRRHYRRLIAEGWSGLRLVSEGDSWFQYPILLEDVIDQLANDYAIFSLGAAGDELVNMVDDLSLDQTITAEKPHGFLISGGGNDLLGGGRLKIFVKDFDPDLEPAAYLNEHFAPFLNEVLAMYRRLFDRLTVSFPDLAIFCHGYDWALPNNGKWLGRPIAEKGIEDRELQRLVIREIMNRFNAAMQQLADSYGRQVHFVDCRGAVTSAEEWHDELHPTDAGYANVASRFRQSLAAALGQGS